MNRHWAGWGSALATWCASFALLAGVALAQPAKPDEKAGTTPPPNPLADACYAPYGTSYERKIAVCTEAINSATLKGVQQQRTVGDAFKQQEGGASLVDRMRMDLLVASGGVLSHAPRLERGFIFDRCQRLECGFFDLIQFIEHNNLRVFCRGDRPVAPTH